MKGKRILSVILLAILLLVAMGMGQGLAQSPDPQGPGVLSTPLGTTFTYQGQLNRDGELVSGNCGMAFRLYDAAVGGNPVGTPITMTVPVSAGVFTVGLDFGAAALQGDARWLEIAVECPGDTDFTTLSRQELTAAPYALYAQGAPWGGLTGMPAGFADRVDNDSGGDITAVYEGAGLTGGGETAAVTLTVAFSGTGSSDYVARADHDHDGRYWMLGGNAVSTDGVLGTTNGYAFDIRVNNARALRLEPNATSPNIIGGYADNWVTSGAHGATIGGGGSSGYPNRVTDHYGTVGGGIGNQANSGGTVGGGSDNTAAGDYATVGGGVWNSASGGRAAIGGGDGNIASNYATTVGGGNFNTASGERATVGGGEGNSASNMYTTVGGGDTNTAGGAFATVGGGEDNGANFDYATIGGGQSNRSGGYATVGGGAYNEASNGSSDGYATIGGGRANIASGELATIGGGDHNTASGERATIGGGEGNIASNMHTTVGGGSTNTAGGAFATVGGGEDNGANFDYATIGGGQSNRSGGYATVGGGAYNEASNGSSDGYATIGGGRANIASGELATIGGGDHNTASGLVATVPGGINNTAAGAYSFAAGRRAQANNQGCFVWGDATDAHVACDDDNRWVARASGGVYFYTSSDLSAGVYVAAGDGSWSSVSDRNLKENLASVDGQDILTRLAQVPITTWNYRSQAPYIRHIGPVAQDFYAAFGVGEDDTHISTVDADGVALAAIQGLHSISQEQAARIAQLESENTGLREENASQQAQMDALAARLAALEARRDGSNPSPLSFGGWGALGLGLVGLMVGLVVTRGGGLR